MAANPKVAELANNIRAIVSGYNEVLQTYETPDGKSAAAQQKLQAVIVLTNSFNAACGMMDAFTEQPPLTTYNELTTRGMDGRPIPTPELDEKTQIGVRAMIYAENMQAGQCPVPVQMFMGGKGNKYKRIQKGGEGESFDRYDAFTMMLLGTALVGGAVAYGPTALGYAMQASQYVLNSTIDYAVQLGIFKQQCDGAAGTTWNLVKQYSIGMYLPVETCIDKIRYNQQQIAAIQASLSLVASVLTPLTIYLTKDLAVKSIKAVYSRVKENISVPVVDLIVAAVSKGTNVACAVASAAASRVTTRSRAQQSSAPAAAEQTEAATQQAADEETRAIATVTDQLKTEMAKVGDNVTPEVAEQIIALLKSQSPPAPAGASAVEGKDNSGGRRRRKRATRKVKGRKGKKAKTAKRGRKSKSLRKGKKGKGKKGKRTRRNRK